MDLDAYSSMRVQSIQHHAITVHTTPEHTAKHILNKRYQPVDAMPVRDLATVPNRPDYGATPVYHLIDEQPVQSDHIVALLRGPPAPVV